MTHAAPGCAPATPWTRVLDRAGAPPRRRLVVFPHAGGGATAYLALFTDLPEDVEIVAVTLPGRDERMDEAPTCDLDRVVDAVAADLRRREQGRPLPTVLFGHSLGAQLAVLAARSARPAHMSLVLSAQMAPSRFALRDTLTPRDVLYGGDVPQEILDDPDLLHWVTDLLTADLELSRRASRALAAVRVEGDLLVLGGRTDPLVDRAGLLAWREHAGGRFHQESFAGGHFYLFEEPARRSVLDHVTRLLDRLAAPAAPTGGRPS